MAKAAVLILYLAGARASFRIVDDEFEGASSKPVLLKVLENTDTGESASVIYSHGGRVEQVSLVPRGARASAGAGPVPLLQDFGRNATAVDLDLTQSFDQHTQELKWPRDFDDSVVKSVMEAACKGETEELKKLLEATKAPKEAPKKKKKGALPPVKRQDSIFTSSKNITAPGGPWRIVDRYGSEPLALCARLGHTAP